MQGSRQGTVHWKWSLPLAAVLGAALLSLPWARAQQQPPVLPETTVEGSQTPTPPTGAPPAGPATGAGTGTPGQAPLSSGGPFASPLTNSYQAPASTTGAGVNMPNLDFPGSVDVVPQPVLRDQQVLNVDDILKDVPSAIKFSDFRRPDNFLLRGFEVRARDWRWNGFVDISPAPRDFANIQRIEILEGPASVLYGSGQPAGVVNVITKKALTDPYNLAEITYGDFNLFRVHVDSTGPIDEGGHLLYRINAAYEGDDSFRNFGFLEKTFAAPVLTWVVDEDTSLIFEGSFLRQRQRLDTGVVAFSGQPGFVPISNFYGQPTDFQRFNDYKTSLSLIHRFDENWTGRLAGFAQWHDSPAFGTVPILFGNDPSIALLGLPGQTLLRQVQDTTDFREQYYSIIAQLNGKFETGPFKHNLLLGTELGWFNSTDFVTLLSDPLQFVQTGFFPFPIPVPSSPQTVFNPTYNTPTPPLTGLFSADFIQQRYGFFAEDMIDLTEHWKLMGGVRYDIADTFFGRQLSSPFGGQNVGFPRVDTKADYFFLSPRVGLIYQPIKDVLSLYGSFSESFDPPPGGNFANVAPLRPETGRIGEGGIKMDLLDKHLSVRASGFYIIKDNVVTQNSFFFATNVGEQRSQGAELNVTGKLTDNWSIIANYSYIDSRITAEADPTLIGDRFRGVPFNNANLWTRYNLIQEDCQTLGVAGGVVFVGARPGDLQNSFSLSQYTIFNAGLFYRWKNLNTALYLENLFDRRYYAGSIDALSVFPGAPFNVRATVGITF